jgi:hypothetical protein
LIADLGPQEHKGSRKATVDLKDNAGLMPLLTEANRPGFCEGGSKSWSNGRKTFRVIAS